MAIKRWNLESANTTVIGTFLRFEVPLIHASNVLNIPLAWISNNLQNASRMMNQQSILENAVLYTDADVIFLEAMSADLLSGKLKLPKVFAAAGEGSMDDYVSGV